MPWIEIDADQVIFGVFMVDPRLMTELETGLAQATADALEVKEGISEVAVRWQVIKLGINHANLLIQGIATISEERHERIKDWHNGLRKVLGDFRDRHPELFPPDLKIEVYTQMPHARYSQL